MTTLLAVPQSPTEADDRLAATVVAQAPRLRAFVRRQVADLSEVEDIVQDAFLELISANRLAEPVRHVAAWLRRVARNRIIDRFRQRTRTDRLFDAVNADDPDCNSVIALEETAGRAPNTTGPDARYERGRFTDALILALDALPLEQREVFVAHELDGKSFKALAAATGVPVNTLLSRKHAAVRNLRDRLRDFDSNPFFS
jgi:RNA polymerase sigma factor (sigma-70 family)